MPARTSDTAADIAADLRQIVRAAIDNDYALTRLIASNMNITPDTLQHMMNAPVWDLALALRAADIIRAKVITIALPVRDKPATRSRSKPVALTQSAVLERSARQMKAWDEERERQLKVDKAMENVNTSDVMAAVQGMTKKATTDAARKLPKSAKETVEAHPIVAPKKATTKKTTGRATPRHGGRR